MELGAPSLTDFGGLRIAWDERVLEPRPWTYLQSRWAAELADHVPGGRILELFAGVGHIGLAAVSMCGRSLVQVEFDPTACAFARRNADAAGLTDCVEIRCEPVDLAVRPGERFPLVIADPPYLRPEAAQRFPDDPRHAVDGGDEGLDLVGESLDVVARALMPGGAVLLQLGDQEQVDMVAQRYEGWDVVEVRSEHADGLVVRLRGPAAAGPATGEVDVVDLR
jgi:methylase of polypeptide subunit release factors